MKNFNELTINDGKILVKTARTVVTEFLQNKNKIVLDKNFETKYSFKSGVFVTLNKNKELRGCIGYPLPDRKLSIALIDASLAAASEDPRFPAVTPNELNDITFEVTVLTPPIKIKVNDPLDYPSQIKIGRDGLIIKHSVYSGLLLPQVPIEYGWNEKEFLEYTCQKAGIPNDYWKRNDVSISRFEGIIFKEKNPNGEVIKVDF